MPNIQPEKTSDGVKLRDVDSGKLVGSLGKGKNPPTPAPANTQGGLDEPATPKGNPYAPRSGYKVAKYLKEINLAKELIANHAKYFGDTSEEYLEHQLSAFISSIEPLKVSPFDSEVDFIDTPAPEGAFRYDLMDPLPQDETVAVALRRLGNLHYFAQPLPIFVYGTLRSNQSNHSRIQDHPGLETIDPGEAYGLALYGIGGFMPFAKLAPENALSGTSVMGEILFVSKDEHGRELRASLDKLEGFNLDKPHKSAYLRTLRRVHFSMNDPDERTYLDAWVYLTPETTALDESRRIPSGDWATR